MKRNALIIGSPGQPDTEDFLPGVENDIANYYRFLTSALGGGWTDEEIQVLSNPTSLAVKTSMLHLKSADYSMVVFSGHGFHSTRDDETFVNLKPETNLKVSELRGGAEKHTLIIDCCRKIEILSESLEALAKAMPHGDIASSRLLYEQRIRKCSPHEVALLACSLDEFAYESARRGGFYSSSLILEAKRWGISKSSQHGSILSVVDAHALAEARVLRQTVNKQHPDIERPRSGPYFPFAVVS